MLLYDSFFIYPCNCYVQFREKIKLYVSVSVSVIVCETRQVERVGRWFVGYFILLLK